MAEVIKKIKKALEAARPIGGFVAAWFFLNALMGINYPTPPDALPGLLLISPEIIGVFIGVGLWASLRFAFHRALFAVLTIGIVFLRLFRVADGLVPVYFNRPFNLYLDSQFFPDLIFLLYSTLPLWRFMVYALGAAVICGVMVWAIWWALKTVYTFFYGRRQIQRFALAAVIIGLLMVLYHPLTTGQRRSIFAPVTLGRVVSEIDFMLRLGDRTDRHLAVFDQAIHKGAQVQKPLLRLNGSDVYVFFIESYGHTLFTHPRHRPLITPFLRDAERRLHGHGYAMASDFLNSPTFGGASWWAHGSLASGVAITSQLRYDLLLTSKVQPLAAFFNRAGYHTVSVMPGTLWPWPAGAFYQFRKKYYAFDFGYRGPKFGWAPMPDQFVLDYILRAEIQSRTQPLFIEFVLVSSHAPFNEQPRYISDWSQIGDGSIYQTQHPVEFPVVWPDLEEASEAYVTSIGYDLTVLAEFLAQMIDGDALTIVLGDHQPNLKITGNDQPWSVPVHVISRRTEFVDLFIQKGYSPGLMPSRAPPHEGIESLFWNLLDGFSE